MKLTEFFDKTFCVNLERRSDRWDECLTEFNKHEITNVERFIAVDGLALPQTTSGFVTPSRLALVLTNVNINNISEYFKFLPEDWDMLYFGGNHNGHVGVKSPEIINQRVCKLHHTFSTHCVAINKKAFQRVLDRINKRDNALDVIYVDLQKELNVYSFYPMIATQRVSFSDIENKVTDYKWLIK